MKTRDEVQALLQQLLSEVTAPRAQVGYSYQNSLATRFGQNAITQNMGGEEEWMWVTAAYGNKHGSSVTNRPEPDSIGKVVERAQEIAKASPEDPEYVPPPGPQTYPPVPRRYYGDVAEAGPDKLAGEIWRVVEIARGSDYMASGLFATDCGVTGVASTEGLFGFDMVSNVDCSVTMNGPYGSGFSSGNSESFSRVDSEALARQALETAEATQNPRDIEPGDYTVIFEPQAVFDFLSFLLFDLEARDADEGTTVFAGKTGVRLFGDRVNISTRIDDPQLPAPPFGQYGLASRNTFWVKDGVVERLYHDRYWAGRKGTQPDPLIFPIFMEGEEQEVSDLVARCREGLLVKRLWYIRHVDRKELLLTGITRDGLFLVKDGRVAAPVRNLRFNESPVVFLKNVSAMSRPQRIGNMAKVPGILSEGFTFSSVTESI